MPAPPRTLTPLPRSLAVVCALLLVYTCLNPLTGWRSPGLPLLDFLFAPWPKYYTVTDLLLNVLGFIPLGFLLLPSLPERLPRGWSVLLAMVLGGLLSFGLEVLQNFLPTRVPSNLDIGCNTLGTLLGALAGVRWGHPLFDRRGWLHRWRLRRIVAGRLGDEGLVLMALWLLTQLTPVNPLFANGDLRHWLDLPAPLPFSPDRFIRLEAVVTATHLIAAGLLAAVTMRSVSRWSIGLVIVLGIASKTLSTASFFAPSAPLQWATPGVQAGLIAGTLLLMAALWLPAGARHVLAGLALLAATALTNLLPDNPYLELSGNLIHEGHFINFHGLTRLLASGWPFLALAYLSLVGRSANGRRL